MGIEELLLETLIKNDVFHNEDKKVSGIAKRAVDQGYSSLSEAQKSVIKPFMKHGCEGYTDPSGHHNDCTRVLIGAELNEAYDHTFEHGGIVCEDCREQSDYDDYRREKAMRD
ncbi:hypothetical protein [Yersinia enterocolitica]|uniref:Hypothetical phage protein n=1 Tax=Yersinia enterocolitica serotype O:8 / biotype 1B (strain NCTC 13174 / 8081) TaxID=393305 RepID=A1JR19_YERE8|nr:hypothetical protein [Yersinia enterocolitica]AJJ23891.1 hypothetical protein CH49_1752 [Yersinia enterocolitica]CAL12385.1 hypothetical phage protein [Yersinia enterocolitica subsp. enterocolitica 8081]HDL8280425.1 hypothetical protein [Yersinia enterocolitica]